MLTVIRHDYSHIGVKRITLYNNFVTSDSNRILMYLRSLAFLCHQDKWDTKRGCDGMKQGWKGCVLWDDVLDFYLLHIQSLYRNGNFASLLCFDAVTHVTLMSTKIKFPAPSLLHSSTSLLSVPSILYVYTFGIVQAKPKALGQVFANSKYLLLIIYRKTTVCVHLTCTRRKK